MVILILRHGLQYCEAMKESLRSQEEKLITDLGANQFSWLFCGRWVGTSIDQMACLSTPVVGRWRWVTIAHHSITSA